MQRTEDPSDRHDAARMSAVRPGAEQEDRMRHHQLTMPGRHGGRGGATPILEATRAMKQNWDEAQHAAGPIRAAGHRFGEFNRIAFA